MHTLFNISSILLVLFGSFVTLRTLRSIQAWSQRQLLQLLLLFMPVVPLGFGLLCLYHLVARLCIGPVPTWDAFLGVLLPSVMVLVACGACVLGLIRLFLMHRLVVQMKKTDGSQLQCLVNTMTKQRALHSVPVFLTPHAAPLAFTCGIRHPAILLSTWMIDHLDQRELEAVVAHEIEHIARRDYLTTFFSTVFRDAFFYLPTTNIVYRQMKQEKELVCDERAAGTTQRPLALASALTKVWLHTVEEPGYAALGLAQPLVTKNTAIHQRIERLLLVNKKKEKQQESSSAQSPQMASFTLGVFTVALFFFVHITIFSLVMTLLGCDPFALLGRLF